MNHPEARDPRDLLLRLAEIFDEDLPEPPGEEEARALCDAHGIDVPAAAARIRAIVDEHEAAERAREDDDPEGTTGGAPGPPVTTDVALVLPAAPPPGPSLCPAGVDLDAYPAAVREALLLLRKPSAAPDARRGVAVHASQKRRKRSPPR